MRDVVVRRRREFRSEGERMLGGWWWLVGVLGKEVKGGRAPTEGRCGFGDIGEGR